MKKKIIIASAIAACFALCAAVWPQTEMLEETPLPSQKPAVTAPQPTLPEPEKLVLTVTTENVVKHILKIELLTQKNRLKRRFFKKGGPSDRIRTCGILLPKQARYQLRYTRIFSFCYYTTLGAKIKDFPVCGQSCGQSRFSARFADLTKSRKRPCRKTFRASAFDIVDGFGNTPKAGALPVALHPDDQNIIADFLVLCKGL